METCRTCKNSTMARHRLRCSLNDSTQDCNGQRPGTTTPAGATTKAPPSRATTTLDGPLPPIIGTVEWASAPLRVDGRYRTVPEMREPHVAASPGGSLSDALPTRGVGAAVSPSGRHGGGREDGAGAATVDAPRAGADTPAAAVDAAAAEVTRLLKLRLQRRQELQSPQPTVAAPAMGPQSSDGVAPRAAVQAAEAVRRPADAPSGIYRLRLPPAPAPTERMIGAASSEGVDSRGSGAVERHAAGGAAPAWQLPAASQPRRVKQPQFDTAALFD
jgi:hypothetical protein